MIGILVFDYLNDVIFVKGEVEFTHYIIRRCVREHLLKDTSVETSSEWIQDYHNALVQLFAPIITSQRIMGSHFNNPFNSIHCEDGSVFVFSEYLGYSYVGIGIGAKVTEQQLHRSLQVFLRMTTFLCGPIINSLRSSCVGGTEKQKLLTKLHTTWDFLYKRVFSITVEAEERLLVNSDLKSLCLKLLHMILEKFSGVVPDWNATHAVLVVNTSILSLYSSTRAEELADVDILMLILLVCSLHPCHLSNEWEASGTSRSPGSHSPSSSEASGQFFSSRASLHSGDSERELSVPETVCQDSSDAERNKKASDDDVKHVTEPVQNEKSSGNEGYIAIDVDFSSRLVFLKSTSTSLIPHVVCTANLMAGMTIVVVFKASKLALSAGILDAIEVLQEFLSSGGSSKGKSLIGGLENILRDVTDNLKKFKTSFSDIDQFLKKVNSRWTTVKKNGLSDFLKSPDTKYIPSSLENSLVQLCEHLKEGFQRFCIDSFSHTSFQSLITDKMVEVQAHLRYQLVDYIDYLDVKASHNITMPTYYKDYSGLVHFIYVDRLSNKVTVPSTDDSIVISERFSQDVIRRKVCQMVGIAWSQLQMGHLSYSWKEDLFVNSYFLWFEDSMGVACKPERPPHGLEGFPMPGVLCGNFYRRLVQECFPSVRGKIRCCELFCIHTSETDAATIGRHAKRLANSAWEASGEGQSLLDLL